MHKLSNKLNILFSNLDCLIIKNKQNLFYISRYANQDAVIILTPQEKYYFTDARYLQEAKEVLHTSFDIIDSKGDITDAICTLIKKNQYKNIGLEQEDINYSFYNKITTTLTNCSFFDITTEIKRVRSIKTPQEIENIKKAQQITDKSFMELLPLIKEGITEIELGHILYNLLISNGAQSESFESIIAFGKNSAKPHALKTTKPLKNGTLIKMDFGAKYNGYCADMTRVVAFGKVTSKECEIYQRVKEAQQLALDNICAGISCKQAYDFSNDYFKQYNLASYFLHSLGHGVGTDVHEMPYLSPKSHNILQENMVVSIEPGLYFANEFGVRIEDIVVVKKNTIENLTKSKKEMIIL